ncbi:HNH endonuclease [Salmonella enterica]|nr:HNH endonuclease [Salmonella enterica]
MWSDIFYYKDGVIYWKVRRNGRNGGVKPGDIAGCKNEYGYVVIGYNGKLYYRHSIVWEMHNGKIPDGFIIDHKNPVVDGLESDDRIENLRIIKHADNLRKGSNRLRSSNSSGITGVSYIKQHDCWRAAICVNGKKMQRNFKSIDAAINQRVYWESIYIK